MSSSDQKPVPPLYDLTRTKSISDSVFSMTLILLVFSLDVPSPDERTALGIILKTYSPELIGYAIGALYVAVMWIKHHRLLNVFKAVNMIFMAINFVVVGVAMLVPFFLGLLLLHINTSDGRNAALLYTGWGVLSVLLFEGLLYYGQAAQLVDDEADSKELQSLTYNTHLMLLLYVGVLSLSFVNPGLALMAHIASGLILLGLMGWEAHHKHQTSPLMTDARSSGD
jgi:uncharacterized membrane protein